MTGPAIDLFRQTSIVSKKRHPDRDSRRNISTLDRERNVKRNRRIVANIGT
jgi:hypothetical protein